MSTLKLLITYNYEEDQQLGLLCARMLEDAFQRREDVEVFRDGDVRAQDADVVFNTLPAGNIQGGKITAWWDIEACNFHREDQFASTIVLAPYNCETDYLYPADRTYLFPFATDPQHWHRHPTPYEYDTGFIGRGDGNRQKRLEWLNYVNEHIATMLWTNGVARGEAVSKRLSAAKTLLQVSGDAGGGVMETRFFELGLIGPMIVDLTDINRRNFYWAAWPDVHFVGVENQYQMVDAILRLSADDAARELMFERATKNYLERHTYDVRAREFLETIGFLKGPGLPKFHKWEGST